MVNRIKRIIAVGLMASCIFTLTPGFMLLGGGNFYVNADAQPSGTGFTKNSEGKWIFIRNGIHDKKYTGLAKSLHSEDIYFARNGELDPNYTGIYKFNGVFYAVRKGKVDRSFTGAIPNEKGGWFFTRKGVYDTTYTGLAKQVDSNTIRYVRNGVFVKYTGIYKYNGTFYAVRDGIVDMQFTGVVANEKGNWLFTRKGIYDTSYTGLAQQINSTNIRYVNSGAFKTYTGIYKYNGTFYSVIDGLVDKNFTGVIQNASGVWCFVKKGVYDTAYVGLAKQYNSENILYVKNGKWDKTYNGVYKYNGVFYAVINGKVDLTYTGLIKNASGVWVYTSKGVYNTSYTGLARKFKESQDKLYYVSGGKTASHTGLVKFEGKHFAVRNGEVDYTFTGIIQNKGNGNWHYCKNGIYDNTYTGPATSVTNPNKWHHVKAGYWDPKFSGTFTDSKNNYAVTKGIIKNAIITSDGNDVLTDADGRENGGTGIVKSSAGKYYFMDPATKSIRKEEGFFNYDGKRYYSNADGSLKNNEIFKIDEDYYGAQDGAALAESGWVKTGELSYYYTDYVINKVCFKAKAVLDSGVETLRDMYDWSNRLPFVTFQNNPDWGTCWFADYGFTKKQGNCYVKSSTIYMMAKMKGYDILNVRISAGHAWCYVDMDGVRYIVDPSYGYMVKEDVAKRDKDWYSQSWTEMPMVYEG